MPCYANHSDGKFYIKIIVAKFTLNCMQTTHLPLPDRLGSVCFVCFPSHKFTVCVSCLLQFLVPSLVVFPLRQKTVTNTRQNISLKQLQKEDQSLLKFNSNTLRLIIHVSYDI